MIIILVEKRKFKEVIIIDKNSNSSLSAYVYR